MVGTPQWYDKKISFQQSDQINQDRIQLSFNTSDLTDGTYFVAPVVQSSKDEHTDNYYPIRNVPQLEFEITANKRYVKNDSTMVRATLGTANFGAKNLFA